MIDSPVEPFHAHCFACGNANVQGLRIQFNHGPDGSIGEVSIPSQFQSYDGIVHGGIVATILDAAMIHSVRRNERSTPLTCRLEIRYLKSVPHGASLIAHARKIGRRGRVILAESELIASGVCCARARGAFAFPKKGNHAQLPPT